MSIALSTLRVVGTLRSRRHEPTPPSRRDRYTAGWLDAATRLDLAAEDLGEGYVRVATAAGPVLLHGAHVGIDDIATYFLVSNRRVSSELLERAGVSASRGTTYAATSAELRRALRRHGPSLVVKPSADSGGGRGITSRPATGRQCAAAVLDALGAGPAVVCEPHRDGAVHRVLVLHGEVLDTVVRHPATVVGDGTSTVLDLVARENRRRRLLGPDATGLIPTGADLHAALGRQKLTPRSTPAAGRVVTVSGRSNTGSELESRRVAASSDVADVAVRAAAALGVHLAGVDVVVDAAGRPEVVLEVNTAPGLHWHQLVEADPYDVFVEVLKRLDAA
jgi:hypothetical protein